MDIDGVTSIGQMNQVVLAGGPVEKTSDSNTLLNQGSVTQKLILGDKYGSIHILDVSRKLVLDKLAIPHYDGRRITNISTAVLQWVDTRLIYAAVVARGSPVITVVCFKHNENRFHTLYTLNVCPTLENPDALE